MRFSLLTALALMLGILLLSSCGIKTTRTDRDTGSRDLTGNWNDKDAQLTAQAIVDKLVQGPWVDAFVSDKQRKPVVRVGSVKVNADEIINEQIFVKELRNAMVNSPRIRVRSGAGSNQVRDIQKEQDLRASADTKKEMFQETGSDFVLTGTINVQNDQYKRKKDKAYRVDMELRDVQNAEVVWVGDHIINKQVDRSIFD